MLASNGEGFQRVRIKTEKKENIVTKSGKSVAGEKKNTLSPIPFHKELVKQSNDGSISSGSTAAVVELSTWKLSRTYKRNAKIARWCVNINKKQTTKTLKWIAKKAKKNPYKLKIVKGKKLISVNRKIITEKDTDTFAYLNNPNNKNQYTYQFKRKKKGSPKSKNKETILTVKSGKIEKSNGSIKESKTDAKSLKKGIKSLAKTGAKGAVNNAWKSKTKREDIGNSVANGVTGYVTKKIASKIMSTVGYKFLGYVAVVLVSFVLLTGPIIMGAAAIFEGYAVVVEFVETITEDCKNWWRTISAAAGTAWDAVRSELVDTQGADKVDLNDMVSVEDFLREMLYYELQRVSYKKSELEAQGYNVTIYDYSGMYEDATGDDAINMGDKYNGASQGSIKKAWSMLIDKGYTEEAAAGVIGNWCQESALKPSAFNPNGHFGIVQWSLSRWANENNWCKKHGFDEYSLDGQLHFAIDAEIKDQLGKDGYKKYIKMTDVAAAAAYIEDKYERAGGANLSDRIRYAKNVYELCKGTHDKDENKIDSFKSTFENLFPSTNPTTFVDESSFCRAMKPLWLSVMYGKYEYEPSEMEMYDTAEDIASILVKQNIYLREDKDEEGNVTAKNANIYVKLGSIDEVLDKYYRNDIETMKANGDDKLAKLEADYDLALSLLEYYKAWDMSDFYSTGSSNGGNALLLIGEKSANEKINKLIEFALSKVGNPYVWGGTDVDHGADCSGFVMKCFEYIGISLPRTSYNQVDEGKAVSMKELKPGDLIFYTNNNKTNGKVNHVAIYIGNGMIVNAASKKSGICTKPYNYRNPIYARRIIE